MTRAETREAPRARVLRRAATSSEPLGPPSDWLSVPRLPRLQRAAGNAAVTGLVQRSWLDDAAATASSAWGDVKGAAESLVEDASSAASSAASSVGSLFDEASQAVGQAVAGGEKAVSSALGGAAAATRAALTSGMTGSPVSAMQQLLGQALGIALPATGAFDEATRQAVLAFQKASGLKIDGIVGPRTLAALHQAAATAGGGGSSDAPAGDKDDQQPKRPGTSHYRVEMKAWIPHPRVVDPEAPSGLSLLAGMSERRLEKRMIEKLPFGVQPTGYLSHYRGDSHAEYDGSYRVMQVVEFDWDGSKITNFAVVKMANYGTSHRDVSIRYFDVRALDTRWIDDTDEDTATTAVTGSKDSDKQLSLGIHSANPLTMVPSPDIDADILVGLSTDPTFGTEEFSLAWSTDLMPSHGYRVVRNGVEVSKETTNDISGMEGDGPAAAAEIFMRLNSKSNGGHRVFSFLGDQQVK